MTKRAMVIQEEWRSTRADLANIGSRGSRNQQRSRARQRAWSRPWLKTVRDHKQYQTETWSEFPTVTGVAHEARDVDPVGIGDEASPTPAWPEVHARQGSK